MACVATACHLSWTQSGLGGVQPQKSNMRCPVNQWLAAFGELITDFSCYVAREVADA